MLVLSLNCELWVPSLPESQSLWTISNLDDCSII